MSAREYPPPAVLLVRASGMKGTITLLGSGFGLDTLHIDLDDDLVADDHAAIIQGRAKVDIEVPPIDLSL